MDKTTNEILDRVSRRRAELGIAPPAPRQPRSVPSESSPSLPSKTSSPSLSIALPEQAEARQRRYEREEVWDKANMPARHRARIVAGVELNIDHAAQAWQTAMDGGLLALVGTRGSGKTQLAVGLAHAWVMGGRGSAWYTRADDMFDSMRREFDEDGKQGKAMAKLVRTGLLIIDELADRVDSAFETRELNRLIDKRYASQLPTVMIANLTAADFAKSIGASATSRMQECGRILVMDGQSYRSRAAQTAGAAK